MSEFKKERARLVQTFRVEGQSSTDAPARVHNIPKGAGVKIYPTSAGEAAVYSTTNKRDVSDLDDTSVKILANTNANWDVWGAGAVTASTVQVALVPVETVAIVVTSGEWTMEVCVSQGGM